MDPIKVYLSQLQQNLQTGQATEHTHRPALQHLIQSLLPSVRALNEPRQIDCGAPDYVLQRGEEPLGYIEAKDIGENLDKVQKSDQLNRYRESLNNLILTDYLEFRWFLEGEYQRDMTVRLAEVDHHGRLKRFPENFPALPTLLETFSEARAAVTLRSPDELAAKMAKIARLLRDLIGRAYQQEDQYGRLHAQLESFRQVLLDHLMPEQFADMYAQTICYGLFAAKCSAGAQAFSRIHAGYYVPKTNPFLRNLFNQIAGVELDDRLAWLVDHLVAVLNRTDIAAILANFGKRTRQEDPVVHFYETFLAQYDPALRETRGVYYTPEPVVSYIVRSLDEALRRCFGLQQGLADNSRLTTGLHKVQILDLATGTGTFLYAVFARIFEQFLANRGLWSGYVSQHLLPRVHGFELLMAPYTVAHMKLGLQLQDLGYDFHSDERLRVFLTNTLDQPQHSDMTLLAKWLSDEANAASAVKQDMPVMVILGNPPYSGHSANKGEWINNLLRGVASGPNGAEAVANYFQVDGQPLKERNPKWLNDDYVKFIRFAHWRIMQTGYGVLGLVTNHGYLDNPTFRGMRQALMRDFDEIYVLDLHGNSKKKEKAPDGSPDKNVFDIQQGVAIGIFVKFNPNREPLAKVFHAEVWGERKGKYQWLLENDFTTTAWKELQPQAPFYLFVPQDGDLRKEYEMGWKITDFMRVNGWGIATRKDYLLIDFIKENLISKFKDIVSLTPQQAIEKYEIRNSPHWDFQKAHSDLSTNPECFVKSVLFRPLDIRFIYYEKCMIERGDHRFPLMSHMLNSNLSFITVRRTESGESNHFYCSNRLSVLHSTSAKEGNFVFPLYIYPSAEKDLLSSTLSSSDLSKKKPNLSLDFIDNLQIHLNLKFVEDGAGDLQTTIGPEDIFHYMYAVFHSSTYRQRYAEFLKIDFPRLPLTSDKDLFRELTAVGRELVSIHLMEADLQKDSGYPAPGDNKVEKVEYKNERVYINKTQYFDKVKSEVWEFYIGGYQVCQKWLKDRKGRSLSYDDCEHYRYILAAIERTMTLMESIDQIIPGFPLP